jgi:23S rRNA (uracil1939-C5)-methyltransferase
VNLTIDKPVYGGDSLGRAEEAGKAIFVPFTLPGEIVDATINEEKRTYAKAELDAVLTPSPSRVVPACAHFGVCGGCHYQHADYAAQLTMKQQILRETLTRAGVSIPSEIAVLASSNPWAYRNRIRMALTKRGELAYRGRRSHELVPIRECPIAAPILFETAQRVAQFLMQDPAPAAISEMDLFINPDQSQLQLTLFAESAAEPATSWLDQLHSVLPLQTTGLRLQVADNALNATILAAQGHSSLTYEAANFPYRVDHGAFFQINRWMIDDFAALVVKGAQGSLAWDLYAGVGLFARQLAACCGEVVAVESAPASLAALQENLAGVKAGGFASTTLDFLRRNREQREARPDLIILDPPRAGLGDQVTHLLNAIHAPEMVYVSCDPTTLARDLRRLTQERYRIESITLADMFPQTFHVETVVRLRRA